MKAMHKTTYGAEGRTRTGTARATAPSRRRVYQFHHFGNRLFDLTADHGAKHYHDHWLFGTAGISESERDPSAGAIGRLLSVVWADVVSLTTRFGLALSRV